MLGLDYTDPWSTVGRSDTIILTTFILPDPYVGMISIPRDLWVTIPEYGENRINTAHFFAESQQVGMGPSVAMQTVERNFGVDVDYFVRIRFQGFKEVINAMGGLDIELDKPMAGYPAGKHHLTGNKALAFARNRQGSDDFFRMARGQMVLKAMFIQMLNPSKWLRIPAVLNALSDSIDTNIPTWLWPRLSYALLYNGPDGINSYSITREMVHPFVTNSGAQILLPNWDLINPFLLIVFGQ